MPNGAAGDGGIGRAGRERHDLEITDGLGIDMNLTVRALQKALDLLHDAKLCSVAAIEKRRNDNQAQISFPSESFS